MAKHATQKFSVRQSLVVAAPGRNRPSRSRFLLLGVLARRRRARSSACASMSGQPGLLPALIGARPATALCGPAGPATTPERRASPGRAAPVSDDRARRAADRRCVGSRARSAEQAPRLGLPSFACAASKRGPARSAHARGDRLRGVDADATGGAWSRFAARSHDRSERLEERRVAALRGAVAEAAGGRPGSSASLAALDLRVRRWSMGSRSGTTAVLLALGVAADGQERVLGLLGGVDGASAGWPRRCCGTCSSGVSPTERARLFVLDGSRGLARRRSATCSVALAVVPALPGPQARATSSSTCPRRLQAERGSHPARSAAAGLGSVQADLARRQATRSGSPLRSTRSIRVPRRRCGRGWRRR